LLVELFLQLV
jgi:hypothetical protein